MSPHEPLGGLFMGDPAIELSEAARMGLLLLVSLSVTALVLAAMVVIKYGLPLGYRFPAAMTVLAALDIVTLLNWDAVRRTVDPSRAATLAMRHLVFEPLTGACRVVLIATSICLAVTVAGTALYTLRDWLEQILVPCPVVAVLVGRPHPGQNRPALIKTARLGD